MGNFICAASILTLTVLFVIVNTVIICNVCDEIINLLDQGQAEAAKELWEQKKGYISFFVKDKEIDAVDFEAEKEDLAFRDAISEIKTGNVLVWQSIF